MKHQENTIIAGPGYFYKLIEYDGKLLPDTEGPLGAYYEEEDCVEMENQFRTIRWKTWGHRYSSSGYMETRHRPKG